MAFVTEKEELKPGLILFRRGDVDHRMWYCRMKMPKADRYKTVSLKTTDISAARERGTPVPRRSILSVTNAGAAIRHGGGRTARDATGATAFEKSPPTQRKPSQTMKPSAAPKFSRLWASEC